MRMRSPNRRKLTQRVVEALPTPDRERVWWDRELSGFGVRVYPSGSKVYMVHTRANGKSTRVTIGSHRLWSVREARREAARMIVSLKEGGKPTRPGAPPRSVAGPTVGELADDYMNQYVALHCRSSTAQSARHLLDKYIVPYFGSLRFGEISPGQVATFHGGLRETPAAANQAVALLARLYRHAEVSGHAVEGGNPCRFIKRYPAQSRVRVMSNPEVERLGIALNDLESRGKISTSAATALRLLLVTGCRRNEILNLRWEDVDLEHGWLRLRDATSSARSVSLCPVTRKLLTALPRQPGNPWVIAGRRPGTRLSNLNETWKVVRAEAGLDDVRIEDFRAYFVSTAVALGVSLTTIGKLLGHKQIQTTARYVQLARDAVKAAAESVSASLAADMDTAPDVWRGACETPASVPSSSGTSA